MRAFVPRVATWVAILSLLGTLLLPSLPVAADQSDGTFYAGASVDYPTPRQYTTEVVRVIIGSHQTYTPVVGGTVCTVWHYRTTDTKPGCVLTDTNGNATISHYISGATRGYTVTIDITVDTGDGPILVDHTSFTPA